MKCGGSCESESTQSTFLRVVRVDTLHLLGGLNSDPPRSLPSSDLHLILQSLTALPAKRLIHPSPFTTFFAAMSSNAASPSALAAVLVGDSAPAPALTAFPASLVPDFDLAAAMHSWNSDVAYSLSDAHSAGVGLEHVGPRLAALFPSYLVSALLFSFLHPLIDISFSSARMRFLTRRL